MRYLVSRRLVLSGLGSSFALGAAWAGAPLTSLRPQQRGGGVAQQAFGGPEGVIARAGLSGDVSFAVADVHSGQYLEGYRETRALPPASVAKALTALYALDALGPGYRFRTRLLRAGTLRDGVLHGDLILAGGGDPTLDTIALGDLARQLKASGLREVRGGFYVYDGALPRIRSIDPEQPDHVGYSPAVSGIALNHNRVHFEWKRVGTGYSVTMDARANGYRPDVRIARMRVVKRDLPVYTYEDRDGTDHWTVASLALGNGGARWLPVRRPAAYAGDVFATLARSHGIVLPAAQVTARLPHRHTPLGQHVSAPLQEILRGMLKYSNNLTAEMVGLSASVARWGRPGDLAGSAGAMSDWAAERYGMARTRMVDHSGLSDTSRMTPSDLVGALVAVRRTGVLRPLLKPFAMRDSRGAILDSHPIKVDAKTGTLNFVSGLGGFMTAANGAELAFAIFTADTETRSRIKRADREVPQGARPWNRRSKQLQQSLIERWGALYGS